MGRGELSAAIADYLSASNATVLTCDEIAVGLFGKLGYTPSNASISRVIGQRTDWQKMVTGGGKAAFKRR